MLDRKRVVYRYRDYVAEPLSREEIENVLEALGVKARAVLRRNDKAYKELGLTGDESERKLIGLMAEHPTLLQRPVGVVGNKAVVGRPPENLLELV